MRKILAIDDKADNLTTIVAVLKIHIPDCVFFTALSGKEGLEIANNEQPDVILLDIIMSDMDGYETCKLLKGSSLTKHIPVILITAIKTDSESRIKGLNTCADAFLSKPIDASELTAQVNVMLRIKKAEDELRADKEALSLKVNKRTKELKESEEKYRSVFVGASDGLILFTSDLSVVDVSPAFTQITGISPNIVIGKSSFDLVKDFVDFDQVPNILKIFKNIIENNQSESFEIKFNNRNLLISIKKQMNGQSVGLVRDITETKKESELLKEREEYYRALIENSSDVISILNEFGHITYESPSHKNVLGYELGELIGRNVFDLIHPDDVKRIQYQFKSNLDKTDAIERVNFKFLHKNGSWIYLEGTAKNLLKSPQIKGVIINYRDVTERKQAEISLLESELRLRRAIINSPFPIMIHAENGEVVMISNEWSAITGYSHSEISTTKKWVNKAYPADSEIAFQDVKRLYKIKKRIYEGDFEILTKKGEKRVWEFMSAPLGKLPDGRTTVITMAMDITDRKMAEIELKENVQFIKSIVNLSRDMLYIYDLEKTTNIYSNSGIQTILGYSSEELVKIQHELFSNLMHPDDYQIYINETYPQYLKVKDNEAVFHQYRMKHKNGNWIWLDAREIVYLRNSNGSPKQIFGVVHDITKLKHNEERIFKLSTAVEQSPSIITITDLNGIVEYVNPKFTDVTGYKFDEVINKNARILKSENIHKNDYQELWNTITIGKEWHGEFYNKKKNGDYYWESASISPIFDDSGIITNYIKIGEDITLRKKNELIQKVLYNISNAVSTTDNLEKLVNFIKQQLNLIIDTSNFFLAFYDNETDTFTSPFMNDEKDNYDTWPAGKTFSAYVVKTSKSLFVDEKLIMQMEKSGDIEIVGAVPKVGMIVPIKYEGVTNGVFAIQNYTDANAYSESDLGVLDFISDLISLYINRIRALDKLKSALNKATESDRLKTAFLQNVSHEIRTPMNGILGFTSLLNDPDLSGEEQQSYINIITLSGKRMLSTLNDLMDISMLETGQVKISLTQTNINEELDKLFLFFKPDVDNKGMELNYSASLENEFVNINIDRDKFYAILSNLIKNAIKYSKTGSINFGYEYKEDVLEFFVKDTGIGIPENRQEAIFKRFIQADIEDIKVYEGAGLGLSISKAYVEMLGGKIWVHSSEGKGSEFYFTIPYNTKNKKKLEIINKDMCDNKETEKVRLKILIVEDEEIASEYLSIILGVFSPTLLFARTGIEAISICKENADIDLVLMDIKMPIMGGYEATREIREFNKNVVIIAQTAYALGGDREKAISAGCDDYVTKPIDSEILIDKIKSVFSDRL